MKILVTGGAGFVGSHLCEALVDRGDTVVCLDDLSSGSRANVTRLLSSPRFTFVEASVLDVLDVADVDGVMHLASPASPVAYLRRPIFTLRTGSEGTRNALDVAVANSARFVLASTSEVYGDPLVHPPQTEEYWGGNVNPAGPRSVYDEAKRYAEALTTAYRTACGADTGIVRIFNTYGPRMRSDDGRVVSSFIDQALRCAPLTVFGDGSQTRSLCYVDDLVRGCWRCSTHVKRDPSISVIRWSSPFARLPRWSVTWSVRRRRSSFTRCRKTTRPAASPTSRRRASVWAGAHGCGYATGSPEPSSGMPRHCRKSVRDDHSECSAGRLRRGRDVTTARLQPIALATAPRHLPSGGGHGRGLRRGDLRAVRPIWPSATGGRSRRPPVRHRVVDFDRGRLAGHPGRLPRQVDQDHRRRRGVSAPGGGVPVDIWGDRDRRTVAQAGHRAGDISPSPSRSASSDCC